MKKLLIICCLAIFLAGCAKMESPTKPEAKGKPVPPKAVVAAKPAPAVKPKPPMEPLKGRLSINVLVKEGNNAQAFRYAEIFLDGAFISRTSNIELYLDPGPHMIAIKAQGYKPYERNITMLPGNQSMQVQAFNVLLEPE